MSLRKRSWGKKKSHSNKILTEIFKMFFNITPELSRYRIGSFEKTSGSIIAQGRIRGRYNADYELDATKDGEDVIVKFNIWGKKREGISYRVSYPVAAKVANKFSIWFHDKLSAIRAGEL